MESSAHPALNSATRVLVVDPLHREALERLESRFEVTVRLRPSDAELRRLIGDAEVLVMRSGIQLTAEAIGAARALRLVARAGVGVDNIDLAAAKRAGVRVFNVPAQSATSVAEFALALALALTRRIPLAAAQVRRNEWRKPELVGDELQDATMGVVGLGAIGSLIAARARGFQMRVLANVGRPTPRRRRDLAGEGVELVDLDELLREADVVCLAVPLTESTCGLLAARELELMGPRSYLVNVSRAGVVDEADLHAALADGRLAGAALDVVASEGEATPLAELDNVVVTPHIGAMTDQAQRRVGEIVVSSILSGLDGGRLANQVC
ncbi:MAG TPA: NAD(P)-dependent oxidoreductase [Solirubrobacterales bacterium]|nr:NAD(P)-dependent oxidoreductase [Solirubrobacterales bacterium]